MSDFSDQPCEQVIQRRIVREFKKRNHNRGKSPKENQVTNGNSLEIQPVINAVREYGRRTHSIGALQGAHAMQTLIDSIRALGPQPEELQKLLERGDNTVSELRSYLHKAYK